jgi:hypothetical protein
MVGFLASKMNSLYKEEVGKGIYLSLREVLEVLKIVGVEVEANDEGAVASISGLNDADKVVSFLQSFGIPFKSIKKLSNLRKSLKHNNLSLDSLLTSLSNDLIDFDRTNVIPSAVAYLMRIYSSREDDKERSIRSYRKTIRFTAFLTFPLMIGLVSIAEPLISILLKKEWAGCIPFFQLTCIAGIFTILTSINQNFIKVYGRSDVIFKLEIVRTVLIILGLLVSLKESALVMIGIQTLIQAIIYLISIIYIGHSIEYSWTKQLKDILPYTVISVLMWGLLVIPEYYIGSYYALLLTKMTIGILFYYITNKYLGSQILREAVEILFKQKSK